MFFTNMGRVYRIKAYEIPEASRTSRGTAIINIIPLQPDEKITAMIPIKDYEKDKYLFMATKNGIVKKLPCWTMKTSGKQDWQRSVCVMMMN